MKNKKGFTLVELLAVIVILALIMSIAVISIGGVLNSTRQNTFKETAVTIINGVRQQLIINNKLDEGTYEFKADLLDKGADLDAPLGGKLQLGFTTDPCPDTDSDATNGNPNKVGDYICKHDRTSCTDAGKSYVKVSKDSSGKFVYSICLTAGADQKYINVTEGTEANLLNNSNTTMIYPQES